MRRTNGEGSNTTISPQLAAVTAHAVAEEEEESTADRASSSPHGPACCLKVSRGAVDTILRALGAHDRPPGSVRVIVGLRALALE